MELAKSNRCAAKQHVLSICALFAGQLGLKPGGKPSEGEKEMDAEMQDANGEAKAEAEAEEQAEVEAADGKTGAEDATEQPAAHAGKVSSALNAEISPCLMRGQQGLASCNARLQLLMSQLKDSLAALSVENRMHNGFCSAVADVYAESTVIQLCRQFQ